MQKLNADFDTIIEHMEVLKHALKMILNERTQGAIVRSRTKWYEDGEKISKYFINLEKRQSSHKTINSLQLQDGTIAGNPQNILTEQRNFYMQLYTKLQSSHTPDFVNHLQNIRQLPEKRRHNMEQEITEDELLKVLKTTDNNKSLSEMIGILLNWIKCFGLTLTKTVLLNSYKYAYGTGQLSTTQKEV